MDNNKEQFELTPIIEEPTNTFKVVHLFNRNDTYHLTRQILYNSAYTLDTYCLFYQILAKNVDDFNDEYGSFACLIPRNDIEADLYVNVNHYALNFIIEYIQTGKFNRYLTTQRLVNYDGNNIISEMIDLATILGMPKLVTYLRKLNEHQEDNECPNINSQEEISQNKN